MSGAGVIAAGVVGLVAGPIVRRLVDQVPGRRPVFDRPVSELVPVASWFAVEPAGTRHLTGSPDDRAGDATDPSRLSRWRAPVIDLATVAVLAVLGGSVGWHWGLPAFLVFGVALVAVTVIDIDHYRIPDRIVFPTLGACLALLGAASLAHDVTGAFLAGLAGAGAYFAFLFVFFFIWPRGMGFGDVKLALVLGLLVGWMGAIATVDGELVYRGLTFGFQLVLMAALMGSVLGAVLGIGVLMVFGRKGAFPFGPALCLGALLAIVFSDVLIA